MTSTVTFGEGEQVPLESDSEELFVLSIDTKNKKMLVNRSEVDIVIKNGEAIYTNVFDNGNVRDARVVSTMRSTPRERWLAKSLFSMSLVQAVFQLFSF